MIAKAGFLAIKHNFIALLNEQSFLAIIAVTISEHMATVSLVLGYERHINNFKKNIYKSM